VMKLRGNRRVVLVVLVGIAAMWAVGLVAQAQDKEAAARGKVTYRLYCSNCHGKAGKGDGELAALLTVAPTDLTQIEKRAEGEFPADWVSSQIDGRETVRGHGVREMPVWGVSFRDRNDPGSQEEEISEKIRQLVEFLHSIQEKP